jgi:hypothetical protein
VAGRGFRRQVRHYGKSRAWVSILPHRTSIAPTHFSPPQPLIHIDSVKLPIFYTLDITEIDIKYDAPLNN